MPTTEDLRNKKLLVLVEDPEFTITGAYYPNNTLFLHADWPERKLRPSNYKRALLGIAKIRSACRDNGIPAIYCLVPVSLVKWEQMLGFTPIEEWTNKTGGENLVLMKQVA